MSFFKANRPALGVLLAAVVVLLPAASFVWLHVAGGSDGARLEADQFAWQPEGVRVTPFLPLSDLQEGDMITAVNGERMERWAQALFRKSDERLHYQTGQKVTYTLLRNGRTFDLEVTLGKYPLGAILKKTWGTIVFALLSQLIAAFVFFRRSHEVAARLLFLWASSILSATTWSLGLQMGDLTGGMGFWLFKATTFGAFMLFWISGLHFALVFPGTHPIVQKWPRLIWVVYLVPYLSYLIYLILTRMGSASTLVWLAQWSKGETALTLLYLALMLIVVIWNYRLHRDFVFRQKMRWVVFAAILSGGSGFFLWFLPKALNHPIISANVLGLLMLPFPIALAIAIFRYQLFDIELIINRTLVYGTLSALIAGAYIAIVGLSSFLFEARFSLLTSLLATALIVLLFQPLRERLQRGVNQLLYGERDDPYAVLSRLGKRLEASINPEVVLPSIVETVAQALKLPYVAIALQMNEYGIENNVSASSCDADNIVASFGLPTKEVIQLPLVYQSECVGQLILAPRSPGEAFSPADRRLFEDVANQAGLAAYAVRLTADLQRSRQRLIVLLEEERRRMRRDLHDGLGPTLASLSMKIDAVCNLMAHDPTAAESMLSGMKAQAQTALADIRRLVYDLRPPALDELGLIAAIEEQIAQNYNTTKMSVTLEAPQHLPQLAAAAEVAAYRIIMEALTNAERHGEAQNCVIRLSIDRDLSIEVIDDGIGMSPNQPAGVGLISMRERAAELGGTCVVEAIPTGGTRVITHLPYH